MIHIVYSSRQVSCKLKTQIDVMINGNAGSNEATEIDKITDILACCVERVSLGEIELEPLADRLFSLCDSQLENVRYHSECRKPIVNTDHLARARSRKRAH